MAMPEKILVVDSQAEIRRCLSEILTGDGYLVVTADNMADGMRLLRSEAPDLVIAESRLSIGDCLGELCGNGGSEPSVDLIVTGADANPDRAVRWLAEGAYDFLPDPATAPLLVKAAVRRAMQKRRLVFENRLLVEQLEQAAIKDPLTGLYNQGQMYIRLMDEIVRSSRYNHSFLLIVAGIDGFGRFNAPDGRQTGDLVLTHMARLLEANLRSADSIFRYEDGKFVLLLPETRIHQAVRVAERILEGARYHVFGCGDGNPRLTISMGAVEFPLEAKDLPSLIELAGQRLQGVQEAGGDGFQFEDRLILASECDS
jgi:diguanylate cyclase (GGDEF)-like protein